MDANQQKSIAFSRKADAYRSLPMRFKYEYNAEKNDRTLGGESLDNECPPHENNACINRNEAVPSIDVEADKNCSFSSSNSNALKELDCNINDCLQDLDKYLEEIDTSSVILKNDHDNDNDNDDEQRNVQFSPVDSMNNSSHNSLNNVLNNEVDRIEGHSTRMQRAHQFRRTTVDHTRRCGSNTAPNVPTDQLQLWRCKSAKELPTSLRSEAAQHCSTPRPYEILTQDAIFSNILSECNHENETRPRQFGRRATGQPTIMALRSNYIEQLENRAPVNRPASAPSQNVSYTSAHAQLSARDNEITASSLLDSEASSFRSSHIPSPYSSVSTTDSSSSSFSTGANNEIVTSPNVHEQTSSQNERTTSIQREQSDFYNTEPLGATIPLHTDCNSEWPHMLSQLFALISCTLGLCNLCRFCVLVINYGGSFLLQFFILSILFGIPMFWLLMCLGSRIKSGALSMWKISPICKGIGIALILVQFIISIYSSVSIAWIFVYIRDSFPKSYKFSTKLYRLQENGLSTQYIIQNLTKDVSDYFHIDVLQHLDGERSGFKVSDQLALYLSVVWTSVFVVLCRGLRSLGKFTYLLTTLPIGIFVVIIVKMVFFMDSLNVKDLFSSLEANDFSAKQSWIAAAQETFLTWGLLGPSVISITSRTNASSNKFTLRRNAITVVLVTIFVLFLTMLLGLCSTNLLQKASLIYIPGSYDNPGRYTSIYSKASINPEMLSFPSMLVPHYSSFLGEVYRRPFVVAHNESGYQALRFISEIFPAVVALSGTSFTWIWVFLTLAMFMLFGLTQLCIMWKPISSLLGGSTSAVLLSCVTGLMLSIPFATEMGIRILHYTDLLFGASWITPVLWTLLIFGVFLIRGRPYNGDDLVNDLKMSTSISAFLALAWNILLPIGLPVLSIVSYKASNSKQFYHMNGRTNLSHWARKLAGSMQLSVVLIVPIVAIIQIFRYLSKGPSDLFERIQLLYRPPENGAEIPRTNQNNNQNHMINRQNGSSVEYFPNIQTDDSPPKYTPPPSYTTATGARIAKFIRQSIRRSVRRIRSASAYSRPTAFEPEAEMIVTDLPVTQRPVSTHYRETAEDSLDSPSNESNTFDQRSLRSSFRQRQKNITHRVSSLPRIMQHSAIMNDIIIRPSSLTSRVQSDNTSAFRSFENLTQNAEPPARSRPPANESLDDSQLSTEI